MKRSNTRFHNATALALLVFAVDVFGPSVDGSAAHEFQISDAVGVDLEATHSAVAFNTTNEEYLVVWGEEKADTAGGATDEIFGRLLNALGAGLGPPFAISFGPGGTAGHPAVAYNATDNQYFVVWERNVTGGYEIYGRRLSAAGVLLDAIQTLTGTTDDARHPDVAWNGTNNEYLLVWDADVSSTLVDIDIWGQRVNSGAIVIGGAFRVSQMSNPAGNRTAFAPTVAWGGSGYLVCWTSDGAPMTDNIFEVFGQRLTNTGVETGANDFRVSEMANVGIDRDGFDADVIYNATNDDYFMAWNGDGGTLGDNEYETFGQVTEADATIIADDFQITRASDAGADRDSYHPAVTYNSIDNLYIAFAEADGGTLADDDFEVFARRVETDGAIMGPVAQLSAMSNAGTNRDARLPAVAFNSVTTEYLVTWNGDGAAQMDNDDEVFGRLSDLVTLPVLFTSLRAQLLDGAVQLDWAVYADELIAGFRVYRAENDDAAVNIVPGDILSAEARQYVDRSAESGAVYRYSVSAVTPDGTEILSLSTRIRMAPGVFSLDQNYPNPFNPSTTIAYSLPVAGHVTLSVYDVSGAEVARIVDEAQPAGAATAEWHGRNTAGEPVASGTYFYRILAILDDGRTVSEVRKLVLLK